MIDTAWIALIGTVFGGIGLKTVESILAKGQNKVDTATELRTELRLDLAASKEDARLLEHELDEWKTKYFLLLQEHLDLKSELANRPKPKREGGDDW